MLSRAKQFLPFDALKGFKEALKEKEVEYEEKKELSDESLEELENTFCRLQIGSVAKIRYYKNKQYIEVLGKITNIDYIKKKIEINNKEYINVADIIKIDE